jgi:hypothetical protein
MLFQIPSYPISLDTNRIFKRHFSAGPAGAQPPWNTPAAMWRIVFTPRRRWVGQ